MLGNNLLHQAGTGPRQWRDTTVMEKNQPLIGKFKFLTETDRSNMKPP